jgi:hypothetical protein
VVSERITLIEALSVAGDLTIYGKGDNILIIRKLTELNLITESILPKRTSLILSIIICPK